MQAYEDMIRATATADGVTASGGTVEGSPCVK